YPVSAGVRLWHSRGKVNLKRHVVRKDCKEHVYYSLSETIRINKNRTVQRRVLNLGELNTTQTEQWQRSIEVIEADGQSRQRRLFTGFFTLEKTISRSMDMRCVSAVCGEYERLVNTGKELTRV